MNAVENTLKHTAGALRPRAHGLDGAPSWTSPRAAEKRPLGSSGIQIRFETDLIIEGIRPGRIVRVRPASWPQVARASRGIPQRRRFQSRRTLPDPGDLPEILSASKRRTRRSDTLMKLRDANGCTRPGTYEITSSGRFVGASSLLKIAYGPLVAIPLSFSETTLRPAAAQIG